MRLVGVLHARGTEADVGVAAHHGRSAIGCACLVEYAVDLVEVVAVVDLQHPPSVGGEPAGRVVTE